MATTAEILSWSESRQIIAAQDITTATPHVTTVRLHGRGEESYNWEWLTCMYPPAYTSRKREGGREGGRERVGAHAVGGLTC